MGVIESKVFEDAQAFCNCVSMDPRDGEEFDRRRGVTVEHGGTSDKMELAKLFRQQEALRAELEFLKNQKLEGEPLPDELLATSVYSERQSASARHRASTEPHTIARFTEKQIQEKMIAKMLAAEQTLDKKYTNQAEYDYVHTSTSSGVTSLIQRQRPAAKDSPRPFKVMTRWNTDK